LAVPATICLSAAAPTDVVLEKFLCVQAFDAIRVLGERDNSIEQGLARNPTHERNHLPLASHTDVKVMQCAEGLQFCSGKPLSNLLDYGFRYVGILTWRCNSRHFRRLIARESRRRPYSTFRKGCRGEN